jgi:MraZ protein
MKYQLTGEYKLKMDAKGRVKLPANLLKQLQTTGNYDFVINRGYEKNLILHPQDVWDEKTNRLNHLDINIETNRRAVRYFYRGATAVTADASDRILLPKFLIQYAGIEKQIVLLAFLNQVEIWSVSAYEEMIAEEPDSYGELSEQLFQDAKPKDNN